MHLHIPTSSAGNCVMCAAVRAHELREMHPGSHDPAAEMGGIDKRVVAAGALNSSVLETIPTTTASTYTDALACAVSTGCYAP